MRSSAADARTYLSPPCMRSSAADACTYLSPPCMCSSAAVARTYLSPPCMRSSAADARTYLSPPCMGSSAADACTYLSLPSSGTFPIPNATTMAKMLLTAIVSMGVSIPPTKVAWIFIAAPSLTIPSAATQALRSGDISAMGSTVYTFKGGWPPPLPLLPSPPSPPPPPLPPSPPPLPAVLLYKFSPTVRFPDCHYEKGNMAVLHSYCCAV